MDGKEKAMRIYGVKILYRIEAGEDIFYEESVVRVQARSFEEAFEKAENYAQGECMDEYQNPYGETVRRSIAGILDCFEAFDQTGDVQEIYSRILFGDDEKSGETLVKSLFERADRTQMMALRVREYNEPWTRRRMRTLLEIFHREVERQVLERVGLKSETEELLAAGYIEEYARGSEVYCRTAARFREEFETEEF